MLPIKDNLPHERPPLVVLALMALNVASYALPPARLPLAPMLLDLAVLALLGASVESRLGHLRSAAVCVAGAAPAVAIGRPAYAAAGATVALLLAYLALFPRARVISLVLVPFLATIVEVPAALLLGAWAAAQLYLGLAG